jgi:hypothetical protein
MYYAANVKSEASPPHVIDSSNLRRGVRVKVTLVARLLLTPVEQKLCRRERGIFTSRMCVHSRTLLRRMEIVCRCC